MLASLVLLNIAVAQDATSHGAGPSAVEIPGLEVTVELLDPTATAFALLATSCDAQGSVELVKACERWVADQQKAWTGAFLDAEPLALHGEIKRRVKGGFVVDISGIE